MKTINTTKLAAMPFAKVALACIVHSNAAVKAKMEGNEAKVNRHCALLDQCAAIGRAHPDNPRRKQAA